MEFFCVRMEFFGCAACHAGDGGQVGPPPRGDVGRAHVAARREGREATHVDTEQAREYGGLGVTEDREFGGELLHGAVALAQLDAREVVGDPLAPAARDLGRGRHESIVREGFGEGTGTRGDIVPGGVDERLVPLFHSGEALLGEILDGAGTGDVGEPVEGCAGDVEVVVADGRLAARGQYVAACRPAGTRP